MVHGIYAADSRNLSTRATFPVLWDIEERGGGSIVRGFLIGNKGDNVKDDYVLGDMATVMDDISVYSFRDGMRTITDALVHELKQNPKVQLRSGVGVMSLRLNPLRKIFEVRC
jgi:protoporphyrinogen/coproporphyrinogen III oxidase